MNEFSDFALSLPAAALSPDAFPPRPLRSYQAPLGLAAAVSTCVGNALGAGDGGGARRVAAIGVGCAVVLQAAIASGVVLLAAEPLVSTRGHSGGT